jgi:uncharacterized membrane protein YraQ (UPF0718 family)
MASDPVTLIQATLAPIFLVSGAAIFLNFTQARLFRVLDRMRAIAKEIKEEGEDMAGLKREKARHLQRAVILRNAILFGVLVIGLTVATTLFILLPSEFEREDLGRWAIVTFTAALASFAVALLLVTVDAFISVAAARQGFRAFVGLHEEE